MPALDALPSKIGPYRLLDKIGEGGMGVVYLARDAESRPVAVKILGPAVAGDPNARRRLLREVDKLPRLTENCQKYSERNLCIAIVRRQR